MRKPVYAICEQQRRSLISAFIVHCLDSIIPLVSISKISSLYLTSVAAQAGLSLSLLGNPEDHRTESNLAQKAKIAIAIMVA